MCDALRTKEPQQIDRTRNLTCGYLSIWSQANALLLRLVKPCERWMTDAVTISGQEFNWLMNGKIEGLEENLHSCTPSHTLFPSSSNMAMGAFIGTAWQRSPDVQDWFQMNRNFP